MEPTTTETALNTPEAALDATREKQAAFSSLMDQMWHSKATQGNFFAEFGGREGPNPEDDNRAYIFTETYTDKTGNVCLLAVTRDGIKSIPFKAELVPGNPGMEIQTEIKLIANGEHKALLDPNVGYISGGHGTGHIVIGEMVHASSVKVFGNEPTAVQVGDYEPGSNPTAIILNVEDREIVDDVLARSISSAENPIKKSIDRDKQGAQMARDLTQKLQNVPAKA